MKVLTYQEIINGEDGIWKPYMNHWVSNLGKVKNCYGKTKCLSSDGRYFLDKNHKIYLGPLLAQVFEIEGYKKLSDAAYCVTRIEMTKDITVDNIKVVPRAEIGERNGKKSRQSDIFKDKMTWSPDKMSAIESIVVPELPNHTIYRNGEIWNGTRWLTFSKSDGYMRLCMKDKQFKVHRLICYGFNPLEGYTTFDSYSKLQVNHKDGNTLNNNADNLEWCIQNTNMQHSYDTELNKKTRGVLQYSMADKMTVIAEFPSLAKASKVTGEPEHRIRDICNDKTNSRAIFHWQWKNKEESDEYSKKFSSLPK
jgi:hypothetical protein